MKKIQQMNFNCITKDENKEIVKIKEDEHEVIVDTQGGKEPEVLVEITHLEAVQSLERSMAGQPHQIDLFLWKGGEGHTQVDREGDIHIQEKEKVSKEVTVAEKEGAQDGEEVMASIEEENGAETTIEDVKQVEEERLKNVCEVNLIIEANKSSKVLSVIEAN